MSSAVPPQTFPPARDRSPLDVPDDIRLIIAGGLAVLLFFPAVRPSGELLVGAIVLVAYWLRRRYLGWLDQPYRRASERWARAEVERHTKALTQRVESMLTLTPQAFEDAVAEMYRALGFHVKQTAYSADGGWDLELRADGKRTLVECKQWDPLRTVGRPILQKLHSAMVTERATDGMLVTTAGFTAPAVEFARAQNIFLIGPDRLAQLLSLAYPAADDADLLFGLCPRCARLAAFPAATGTALIKAALSRCPSGHAVGHPKIVDHHAAVSDEAKRRFLNEGSAPPADYARRARLRELALMKAQDGAVVSSAIGRKFATR